MRRGYTVVEMIVVLAITAIILTAAFGSLARTYGVDERLRSGREAAVRGRKTDETLRAWLHRAALSTLTTDPASYFLLSDASGASELTFTAVGERLPASLTATDLDFQSRNERFGPRGGIAEVSISTTGIGDGANKSGLFLRIQRPADGDPSQGGNQELIDPEVESLSWEFWDG
ncbi:MAG: hypothetical protein C4320_04325, partial [Armatimonadota bacterium]